MSKKTDINSDPFDEFEFKPLTAGLGFHKDTSTTRSSTPALNSKVDFKNSHLTFDTTPTNTVIPKSFNLNSPLPRTTTTQQAQNTNHSRQTMIHVPTIEDDSITKAQTAVNEILKNLNHKKQTEEALARRSRRPEWAAAAPSLSAGLLDSMLITAFFLLSLIAMLAITKIDLLANISNPDPQLLIYWAAFSLLGSIQIIYFVACRAFLGYTPGEWAFDQRCGNELQQASATYVLGVACRAVINAVTGFALMTIISFILRFDVLAAVTGTQIQRQKSSS